MARLGLLARLTGLHRGPCGLGGPLGGPLGGSPGGSAYRCRAKHVSLAAIFAFCHLLVVVVVVAHATCFNNCDNIKAQTAR